MTRSKSYRHRGIFSATEFYAGVAGRSGDAALNRTLDKLGFHAKWVRVLDTYRRARERG